MSCSIRLKLSFQPHIFGEVYATAAWRNDPTTQKFRDLVQDARSWLFMEFKSHALAPVTEHLALRSAGYVHGVAWHVECRIKQGSRKATEHFLKPRSHRSLQRETVLLRANLEATRYRIHYIVMQYIQLIYCHHHHHHHFSTLYFISLFLICIQTVHYISTWIECRVLQAMMKHLTILFGVPPLGPWICRGRFFYFFLAFTQLIVPAPGIVILRCRLLCGISRTRLALDETNTPSWLWF